MIIRVPNPLRLFDKQPTPAALPKISALGSAPETKIAAPEVPAKAVEVIPVANIFVTIFTWIEKEEKVIYADIIKYAPPVAKIAELLFPQWATQIAAGTSAALDVTTLIQNAVLMVEQKYAASGVASGTGTQKAAEVLTLAGSAVTSLLSQLGITATSDYINSLITAVVSILNVQPSTAPVTAVAA